MPPLVHMFTDGSIRDGFILAAKFVAVTLVPTVVIAIVSVT